MLRLEDIWKSFDHLGKRIDILKGISLALMPGDSLALTGASGVGKSTLLHIIGSLEPPTSGHVKFNEEDVYEMDEMALTRFRNKEIGFVFQFHHLLPEFNAVENTLVPALIARYPKRKAHEMAMDVLEKVGLKERVKHRAGELSGGEQQRVAIARAIVKEPALILADEPTGNLDTETGDLVLDTLTALCARLGATLLMATHSQRSARIAGRVLTMQDGRIVQDSEGEKGP